MNAERQAVVKRYTDIERPKNAVNACRITILFLSISVGAVVIFLGVYFGRRAKTVKPPKTPQMNDTAYITYLQTPKILPAWSHTFQSKINGEPAYKEMLTSKLQIELLNKFISRHKFTELMLFCGSVEWSLVDWQRGAFPYQAQFESMLQKVSLPVGALIYLNDLPSNTSNYDQLLYFGKAFNNFNSYMPAAKQLKRVIVQIEPQDESACIKYLEALLLLHMRISPDIVWPTINDYAYTAVITKETLNIFSTLEITRLILEQNKTEISFNEALKLVTSNVAFLFDSPQVFPILQATNKFQALGFNSPIVLYNIEKTKFISGEQALETTQDLMNEAAAYDIKFAAGSYAEMYEVLYKNEPKESEAGWLIDLYRS